jgi:hypothetical protein
MPPVDLKHLNGTKASSPSVSTSAAVDAKKERTQVPKFTIHKVEESTRLALLDSGEASELEQPPDWGIVRR